MNSRQTNPLRLAMTAFASITIMVFIWSCRPDDVNELAPTEEFKQLLSRRKRGAEISQEEGLRFAELIKTSGDVRVYIVDHYREFTEIQQGDIILSIRWLAPEATFPEFNELLNNVATDQRSIARVGAIHALLHYKTPEAEEILHGLIRLRPVHSNFYPVMSGLRVHLRLFGTRSIEDDLEYFLSMELSDQKRFDLIGTIVVYADGEFSSKAFAIVNDMLDRGIAEKAPYSVANFLEKMVEESNSGDERLREHAARLSESDNAELANSAKQFVQHIKGQ